MARKINKTVMTEIANRLGSGETLVSICKDEGMPGYRTVTRAVMQDDELFEIHDLGKYGLVSSQRQGANPSAKIFENTSLRATIANFAR